MDEADCLLDEKLQHVLHATKEFYHQHRHIIKESHGWGHALKVYQHSCRALDSVRTDSPRILTKQLRFEILVASLLHDVDDTKYFRHAATNNEDAYRNAGRILEECGVSEARIQSIRYMISLVSCSQNGNSVPDGCNILQLIPRWSDRIEAVGKRGVYRCYLYNNEHNQPLAIDGISPRPQTENEIWTKYALPERFEQYQKSGGSSTDMISHYYDKLLHVAHPPRRGIQNSYLESQLYNSSKELIEVCLRYGQTGVVDEEYIKSLAS
jgi:uncharacterized protein